MPEHDVAQMCINGHLVNGNSRTIPTLNKDFCGRCGAKTISVCPNCAVPIPGHLVSENGAVQELTPDEFCHKCGKSFPWKGKIKKTSGSDTSDKTLFDIWKQKLLNNRLTAAFMMLAMAGGGIAAMWKDLPDDWKQNLLGSSKQSDKSQAGKQADSSKSSTADKSAATTDQSNGTTDKSNGTTDRSAAGPADESAADTAGKTAAGAAAKSSAGAAVKASAGAQDRLAASTAEKSAESATHKSAARAAEKNADSSPGKYAESSAGKSAIGSAVQTAIKSAVGSTDKPSSSPDLDLAVSSAVTAAVNSAVKSAVSSAVKSAVSSATSSINKPAISSATSIKDSSSKDIAASNSAESSKNKSATGSRDNAANKEDSSAAGTAIPGPPEQDESKRSTSERAYDKAEWIFENATVVKFQHCHHKASEQVLTANGTVVCMNDGSGFVSYVIHSVAPKHYKMLFGQQLKRPYPVSRDYAAFFSSQPTSNPQNGWLRILNYRDLRQGDFIAWEKGEAENIPGHWITGQIMIVCGPPSKVFQETVDGTAYRLVSIPVIDSSSVYHFPPETLPPHAGQKSRDGLAKGCIRLWLNEDGTPIGYWEGTSSDGGKRVIHGPSKSPTIVFARMQGIRKHD